MGKYSVYSFNNPYLEEGDENKYSATVIMDEARERWRTGNWRAKRESFDLERKDLTEGDPLENEVKPAPSPARFKLDLRKDLMGEAISLKKLGELSYSPNYRPQGNLDEHLVTPMTTMQRYDVLAGDLEAPPEDLSFLSDADKRLRRELERSGNKRDGSLRKDTRRLETSLAERRAALIDMLPDADTAEARQVIRESQRRKERMDAEIGRVPKSKEEEKQEKKKKRRNIYAVSNKAQDDTLPDARELSVVRSTRIPQQYGMDGQRPELPEFESETRHWSRITSDSPTWSEVQQHTEHASPSDLEDQPESRRAHYIDDVDYDPDQPFRRVAGIAPRERLYSDEVGQFENEYNLRNGITPERVQEIMDKEYRGRWIPPEYYADDRLVDAWFNDLNRGALEGEDFLDWAYRRRTEAAQARRAAEAHRRAMEAAMRARSQRGYAPQPRSRAEEERRRYEQARLMGYRQGVELAAQRQPDNDYRGMYPDLFDGRPADRPARPPQRDSRQQPERGRFNARLEDDFDDAPPARSGRRRRH